MVRKPRIIFENRSEMSADSGSLEATAVSVLRRLGIGSGELGVALVASGEMAELNSLYMGATGPTDVLSFPLDAEETPGRGEPLLLGDVIICPQVAADQAPGLGNTYPQELCLLLIHGVLHIAGYDHETDSGEMDRLQGEIFDAECGGG